MLSIYLSELFPAVVKARRAKIKRLQQLLRPKRTVLEELINLKSLNLLNLHHLNGPNPRHQSKRPPLRLLLSNPQVLLFQKMRKTKKVLPKSQMRLVVRVRMRLLPKPA